MRASDQLVSLADIYREIAEVRRDEFKKALEFLSNKFDLLKTVSEVKAEKKLEKGL